MSGAQEYIWFDGKVVPADQAKISVKTHALHYGTAVFEGIRAYYRDNELYVFRLGEHSERFLKSAKMLHMGLKQTAGEISEGLVELLRANGFRKNVYIRPIAFVGEGGINLDYRNYVKHVAAFAFPFNSYFERSGLRVSTSSWRRVSLSSMMPRAKAAGNYLNSAIATVEAKLAGYDEALLLDDHGRVSEGAGENVFIVNEGALVTPPVYAAILEGITRQTTITIAGELGLKVNERPMDRSELYTADEVFFTGTAAEIEAVLEVDGRKVGDGTPGKITKELKAAYTKVVTAKSPKHKAWLTPVYGKGGRATRSE